MTGPNNQTVPNSRFSLDGDKQPADPMWLSRWGQIADISWEEVYNMNDQFGNQLNEGSGIYEDQISGYYRVTVQFDSDRPVYPVSEWNISTKDITVRESVETVNEWAIEYPDPTSQGDPMPDPTKTKRTPEFSNQINVERDQSTRRVKGVSRKFPNNTFSVRWEIRVPTDALLAADVNANTPWWTRNDPGAGYYAASCAAMAGTVNAGPFLGFPYGSVLYLGASFSRVNALFDWYEVTHNFEYAPNRDTLNLGDIEFDSGDLAEEGQTEGVLRGHQYVWVQRDVRQRTGETQVNPRLKSVTIENIYPYDDHNCLFRAIVGAEGGLPGLPDGAGSPTINPDNPYRYGDYQTGGPVLFWNGIQQPIVGPEAP